MLCFSLFWMACVCVSVFSFACPRRNSLFATIRKSQALGNRFGAGMGGGERGGFTLQNFSADALEDDSP